MGEEGVLELQRQNLIAVKENNKKQNKRRRNKEKKKSYQQCTRKDFFKIGTLPFHISFLCAPWIQQTTACAFLKCLNYFSVIGPISTQYMFCLIYHDQLEISWHSLLQVEGPTRPWGRSVTTIKLFSPENSFLFSIEESMFWGLPFTLKA